MGRNVVIVQGANSTVELTPLIGAQEWESRRVVHADQIVPTLNGRKCHVGIVVFDEALGCSPSEFGDVAANSAMEWIAVLPPHKVHTPAVAHALASSFFDYLTLPLDRSRLLYSVGHAHGKALLRQSAPLPVTPSEGRYGMIGDSPRMLALYLKIEKVIRTRSPVLITGESGVGKELVALAVHRGSTRKTGSFIPVNCGAIPEPLIGSLLFGHEKGAFTGAHEKQIGSIEAANTGTIFLDEIGDLPLGAQVSLLRFLQESTVVRVGSTRTLAIDARVIAATHWDLEAAVRVGRFREDLFYRLNVLHVEVPPLRERGNDVISLAQHSFMINCAGTSPKVRGFADDAIKAMQRHLWPGNVRELFNRVHRAIVMCDGRLITASDLLLDRGTSRPSCVSLASARSGTDRNVVELALARNRYNVAATARDLAVSRVTLYRLLRRLAIRARR
ncbi:MAG: two-component, sigma-54 specific, transcriptional regulator, Fis family, partial [Gammaproteobacteria bacterium]|nr:two-component, sigma-54 specific, transcriptional regulator, Fis family [Gammaproteobacteria bacterium]